RQAARQRLQRSDADLIEQQIGYATYAAWSAREHPNSRFWSSVIRFVVVGQPVLTNNTDAHVARIDPFLELHSMNTDKQVRLTSYASCAG
ncbi:MAG: hypothetical protein Q8M16_05315, partial [Pirellulaceae bacterium]|nr:hypothetical protein [Pirellulaceae bacterium]